MDWFEEMFIFSLLTDFSDFYLHFIDDIFLIWNGTKTEFDNFLKKKMNFILIKFEYEMSQTENNSLDTTVFQVDNKMGTKVMLNQPTEKVIYTAYQNILIPLRKVLPIARH